MAKNVEHIQHVKSNVVLEGKPKLPQPGSLVEGELAINYAEGVETISIKNSSGDIVTFSSDDYYSKQKLGSAFTDANSAVTVTEYIEENELIVSTALNDLKENKLDVSAFTEYSGAVDTTISSKASQTDLNTLSGTVTAHTANTTMHLTSTEKSQLHTHTNKTYLDGITGSVGTMAYQNTSSYSSATQVNTALGTKLDATAYTPTDLSNYYTKSETSGATEISDALADKIASGDVVTAITESNSGSSAPVSVKVVAENEFVISTALNDLNTNKLDASAYTPTDLSNYYTKSETSGATELSTVFGTGFTVSSITEVIKEDERVTSEALNDLNTRIGTGFSISSVTVVMDSKADKTEDLDGVVLKKITQSAYDALVQAGTVDPNTLYIITD